MFTKEITEIKKLLDPFNNTIYQIMLLEYLIKKLTKLAIFLTNKLILLD